MADYGVMDGICVNRLILELDDGDMASCDLHPVSKTLSWYSIVMGVPIFPAIIDRGGAKKPLIREWQASATTAEWQIQNWWRKWRNALIGHPTGIQCAVLDIDVKNGKEGLLSLATLGFTDLPKAPTVRTPSGGFHLYFKPVEGLRNSVSKVGPGLDWRSKGGFVILPSPGSGYEWWRDGDVYSAPLSFDGLPDAPQALLDLGEGSVTHPVGEARVTDVLTEYGDAALKSAYRNIVTAPDGAQRETLNKESFSIGTAVGGGTIPRELALKVLLAAGAKMKSYDPARPWRAAGVERKVRAAYEEGIAKPRRTSDEMEREWDRLMHQAARYG